jgi:hypothetical protein
MGYEANQCVEVAQTILGTSHCQLTKAYFLPVDLSTAAEEVVDELQKLSFLDRTKVFGWAGNERSFHPKKEMGSG